MDRIKGAWDKGQFSQWMAEREKEVQQDAANAADRAMIRLDETGQMLADEMDALKERANSGEIEYSDFKEKTGEYYYDFKQMWGMLDYAREQLLPATSGVISLQAKLDVNEQASEVLGSAYQDMAVRVRKGLVEQSELSELSRQFPALEKERKILKEDLRLTGMPSEAELQQRRYTPVPQGVSGYTHGQVPTNSSALAEEIASGIEGDLS